MIRSLFVVLLLAGMLFAAACGDDDDDDGGDGGETLTLEEFFAELETRSNNAREGIEALGEEYPEAFEGDVEQTKASYAEYVVIFAAWSEWAETVTAPDEVSVPFEQLKATDSTMNEIHQQRLADVQDAETQEDVDEIFGPDPVYDGALASGTEACEQLHVIADENDIEYSVTCN